MKELDKNKEYITSNLSEERREELIEYLIEEDLEWEDFGKEELLNCVLKYKVDGWHANYEEFASQNAVDANILFEEIKLDKNVSYYLGDLSKEQLEVVRIAVIKDNHALVFDSHPMPHYKEYLSWWGNLWVITHNSRNETVNALTLFDISDKNSENVLNSGQSEFELPPLWCLKITEENKKQVTEWIESHEDYKTQHEVKGYLLSEPYYDFSYQSWSGDRPYNFEEITMEQFLQFAYIPWVEQKAFEEVQEQFDKEIVVSEKWDTVRELLEETGMKATHFGAGEKQQFFFYNSKTHGPNFYTKEEIPYHNGEEWSEDLILYTQLGSNKKFITTKERFKKFKEVWI